MAMWLPSGRCWLHPTPAELVKWLCPHRGGSTSLLLLVSIIPFLSSFFLVLFSLPCVSFYLLSSWFLPPLLPLLLLGLGHSPNLFLPFLPINFSPGNTWKTPSLVPGVFIWVTFSFLGKLVGIVPLL